VEEQSGAEGVKAGVRDQAGGSPWRGSGVRAIPCASGLAGILAFPPGGRVSRKGRGESAVAQYGSKRGLFSRKAGKRSLILGQELAVFRGFCSPMSTQGLSINMFSLLHLP